ncbi:hypothetical protein, partial [Thalassiella azotivora]
MGRRLARFVHVAGHSFAPGDEPPREFADQITNPKAWADEAADGGSGDGGSGDGGSGDGGSGDGGSGDGGSGDG